MDNIVFLPAIAPFLMIVGIVWIKTQARLEEKRIAAGATAAQNNPGHSEALARVKVLEERVRVLERIVTDGGYDLAHKIEALRDDREIDRRLDARQPAAQI